MVLIGDIVGDDADAVAQATSEVIRWPTARGEGFVAVSAEARKRSGSTAAHGRHREAHQRLQDQRGRGDSAEPHGRVHRRHRAHQHRAVAEEQAATVDALEAFFAAATCRSARPTTRTRSPAPNCWKTACSRRWSCSRVRARWESCATGSTSRCARRSTTWCSSATRRSPRSSPIAPTSSRARRVPRPQDRTIRISWKQEIRAELRAIFNGGAFKPILDEAQAIHKRVLRGRVFVALHMHAGDGNVHTNIPVNSDNYEMLQDARGRRAHHDAGALARRRDLRRARHRHHQARVPDRRRDRRIPRLQAARRPEGRFNKGKLLDGADLRNAYTPSFGLMGTSR
jgi:FAD/FMN-containing dehydrogenase